MITKYIPDLFSFGMQTPLCLGFWTVLFTTLEEKLLEQCLVHSRCSMMKKMNEPPACMLSRFCPVWLFVTPWTVAPQAPLAMGFSRQEDWSGLPCPLPGITRWITQTKVNKARHKKELTAWFGLYEVQKQVKLSYRVRGWNSHYFVGSIDWEQT